MSERKEKRLAEAKSIVEAMRMEWLGKHYSPRVVRIIDCYCSLAPLGPEHVPARNRYALALWKEIEAATPADIIAFAYFKQTLKGTQKKDGYGWGNVLKYVYMEQTQIESGLRTKPITRREIEKILNRLSVDSYSARHIDHVIKTLRILGANIHSPRGRSVTLAKRTK